MKILQLHSNFIEYVPVKKEIPVAEPSDKKTNRLDELVVLFVAIEDGDSVTQINEAIKEVKSSLTRLKVNKILLYPYAHLSNNLAEPSMALNLIKKMEKYSKEMGIETYRTPFGWCKQFTISIKGHPLAEQFRVFLAKKKDASEKTRETISEALKSEEKIKSEWFIMKSEGELIPIDKFDFSKHKNLEKFSRYEMKKARTTMQTSPHVHLMKKLELVDNEPGSDPGNLRFYPKGRLIKSLLEQFVTQKVIEYGGIEVETPIMYDAKNPSLANYFNRFPARQYIIKSDDKDLFLRFSACFGQFLMAHGMQISYKQLPVKLYELTRYSFRREKSGELVGLKRLRAFTMPDVHALCSDLDQALTEAVTRFDLARNFLKDGLDLDREDIELAIRFTKDFYEKNKDFIQSFVVTFGKPALIEIWSERFFYFTLKWEFNFVDNLDKASALSTDQIDVESAERWDITFTDEHGKKQYPIILHCSPSGAIERCIYALLEKAYREQNKGKAPMIPLWLSPTQIRIIPISDKYVDNCKEIAKKIENAKIRVDIDNRKESVSKRIRNAEQEWIPYIICIGEKETKSKHARFRVRIREFNEIQTMPINTLIKEVRRKIIKKPFKRLSLPTMMSQRPIFIN